MDTNAMLIGKELWGTQGSYQSGAASVTTSPVAFIRYLGETDSGATLAVNAGGDMAFTTDGTTADTTVIASTGIIDMSTPAAGYNTLGEWLDTVNASANWEACLLGQVRAGLTDGFFTTLTEVDLSTAAYKASGLYLYGDGSVTPYVMSSVITGFDPALWSKGLNPDANCISYLDYASVLINATGSTGVFYVYSASQDAETCIWTATLADNTAVVYGSVTAKTPIFTSKLGERLVLVFDNDQSVATSTGDFYTTLGHTIDITGANFKAHRPTNANLG